jgi:hypothetical protein
MIPAIIPLATQVAADFGVGWIVHGGTKMMTCMTEMGAAKKVCIGVAEIAITGIVSEKVNDYIDDTFDKAAKFIVDHDLDRKFKKGGGK